MGHKFQVISGKLDVAEVRIVAIVPAQQQIRARDG